MDEWKRRLWRAAVRLANAYESHGARRPERVLPESVWQSMRDGLRRLTFCEGRAWQTAATQERESLAAELERLEGRLRDLKCELRSRAGATTPPVRHLYDELTASEQEFVGMQLDDDELVVTTDRIVLEGIDLGPFEIRLDITRVPEAKCFRVVALEPHPASSSDEVVHPHCRDEQVCLGDGRLPVESALAEGRISDFFLIMNRILKTYAEGSAFVELSHWYGRPCHDCDCHVPEDEGGSCNACNEMLCNDCLVYCNGCGDGYCSGCVDRCAGCEEPTCSGCLRRCAGCRRELCRSCFEDDLCATCLEEFEDDSEGYEETIVAAVDAAPSVTV